MVINSDRRRRRNITVRNCRWYVWFQKRDMKNWMYPKS
jgi:surface antigen